MSVLTIIYVLEIARSFMGQISSNKQHQSAEGNGTLFDETDTSWLLQIVSNVC